MALRATILLLSVLSAAATAQTRVSVADVESLLSSRIHRDELASRLTSMELTERVTAARLDRWQTALKDSKSRTALQAIADLSALRPSPPVDISPAPPPDQATQLAILDRATAYTRGMLPRLPDFLAERATTRFEFASLDDLKLEEQTLQLAQMTHDRLHYTPPRRHLASTADLSRRVQSRHHHVSRWGGNLHARSRPARGASPL
jgi:hypothetical protein